MIEKTKTARTKERTHEWRPLLHDPEVPLAVDQEGE